MARHLIDTAPAPGTCPHCKATLLQGSAGGLAVAVDPLPLRPAAELDAVQRGAHSYALAGGVLVHRSAQHIRADAYRARPAVLATHTCGRQPNAEHIDGEQVATVAAYLDPVEQQPATSSQESAALFELTRGLGAVVVDEPPF